jgi:hypothetical protein
MKKYEDLLNIPIEGKRFGLYTKNSTLIADKYQRVVIGQRGPYVEFSKDDIHLNQLYIPKNQLYRLSDPKVYYIEFRTNDASNVKVYYQMRSVAYADYRIEYFYISPDDLYTISDIGLSTCTKQKYVSEVPSEFFETI